MSHFHFPTPLVSVDWLSENIDHPNLVLLDATKPKVGQKELSEEAQTKRIPHARFFDLNQTFKDLDATLPNTMPSPDYFSQEAKKLGINNESLIVIYDHHGIYSSPRAWWMFRVMGHQNVAVLDGGFPAWKNARHPIEKKIAYNGAVGNFIAHFQNHLLVNANEVLASLEDSNVSILDARSAGRFNGTAPEPRAHLRGGHIPESSNLPIAKILDDGKMKSEEAIITIYDQFQLENKKLILSCGSGITACVIALGAEVAGHQNKAVYDGSWTEWGDGDIFPVE